MTPALGYVTLKLLATKTSTTHLSLVAQLTGLMINGVVALQHFFLCGMTRVNSEPGLTLWEIEVSSCKNRDDFQHTCTFGISNQYM